MSRVADLDCPEQLPVNNKARITAHVGQAGLGGQVVKAVLEEDGKPLEQAEVVLSEGDGPQEVVVPVRADSQGSAHLHVRIPPVPEEKIAREQPAFGRGPGGRQPDPRPYIEGTLRAEYGALVQRFLSKDPDLEFCALVQTRPNVFVQRTNMEGLKLKGMPADAATLEKFDVILLGDLDSTALEARSPWSSLVQARRAGAGLLAYRRLSSLGPGGYGGTPLRGFCRSLTGDREYRPDHRSVPADTHPAGRDHPILANIGKFFPTPSSPPQVAGLPPLDGCVR